jgi:hypothetical protein
MFEFHGVRDAGEGGYARRALLVPECLATLREANAAFLTLLARRVDEPVTPAYGLPIATLVRLGGLPARQLLALADCPYALFDLRFSDARFWASLVGSRAASANSVDTPERRFVRTAVFLGWHLARAADDVAMLVLGMTPEVSRLWHGLDLTAIDDTVNGAGPCLVARFGDHPTFWDKLVDSVALNIRQPTVSARLLGLQLLAGRRLAVQR